MTMLLQRLVKVSPGGWSRLCNAAVLSLLLLLLVVVDGERKEMAQIIRQSGIDRPMKIGIEINFFFFAAVVETVGGEGEVSCFLHV